MSKWNRWSAGLLAGVLMAGGCGAAQAQEAAPATQPAATQPDATQPADKLRHIQVHREEGYIDLEGTVVLREGDWLELLVCSPRSREHESILTTPARPSHIHLALLLLGLEPGSPLQYVKEGEVYKVVPPHGPRVSVTLLYEKDGEPVEAPANEWILNQNTGEQLPDNRWLFAGSEMIEYEGKEIYKADANGTVISIVSFGDDLLARPTTVTNTNDEGAWNANTQAIPEVGTKVTLRLRPVPEEEGQDEQEEEKTTD